MEAKYYIGVDISKVTFDVSVFSSVLVAYKKKYEMTKEGFTSFLSYLNEFEGSVFIFMEPTGEYYLNLANYLSNLDYPVYLVNQFKLKNYICANSLRKNKNDKKDSSWIARFGSDSFNNLVLYTSSDSTKLSQLMRSKEFLLQDMTILKNRIRSKLNISFPELEGNYDIFGDFFSLIISEYPSAFSFSKMDIDFMKEKYKTRRGFKVNFLEEVYTLSCNSCSTVFDFLDSTISRYYSILFKYQEEFELLEKEILSVSSEYQVFNENITILESIRGVGFDSAVRLMSFSNIYNNYVYQVFSNYKKWLAFSGTDPTTFSSGSSVRGVSRISRRGSRSLRSLGFTISLSLIQYNPTFKAYYLKKKGDSKKGKKYVFAVWNKFLRVAYHLLSTRQMYKEM